MLKTKDICQIAVKFFIVEKKKAIVFANLFINIYYVESSVFSGEFS